MTDSPAVGSTVDRYELRKVLGAGAMGSVYAAWDPKLHREVALKLVSSEISRHPKARERFAREARAIASLRHSAIVEIYDYSGPDSESLYLVMEKLEGDDLFNLVAKHGAMPEPAVAAVGHELCLALDVAHQAGVIHRDLKPENVFLDPEGRVVLTDFGIVKAVRENSAVDGHDKQTDVIGTPGFMAPELMMNKPLGPYTDIFALGAMLYNIATGRLPYDGQSPVDIFKKMMAGTYDDPRKVNPVISEELCTVLAGMLEPKPKKRLQSVEEVRAALKGILAAWGVTDLREDLREYMQDPKAYAVMVRRRGATTLLDRIKVSVKDKRQDEADRLRARLLLVDPGNEEVLGVTGISKVGAAKKQTSSGRAERGGWGWKLGIGALVVAGLAMSAYLVMQPTPVPSSHRAILAEELAPIVAPVPETPSTPVPPPDTKGVLDIRLKGGGAGFLMLDGEKVGRITRKSIEVPPGEHVIEIRNPRGKFKATVSVRPGETLEVVGEPKK